jgi:hypothetical protein
MLEILPGAIGQPGNFDQQLMGLRHLAFTVDDFEAALNKLRDNGITEFLPRAAPRLPCLGKNRLPRTLSIFRISNCRGDPLGA